MSQPVTIENDAWKIEVYPQFGGKVLSMIDKADEYELLFDFPAEFPTTCQYDQPYNRSYYAGWDECFPAVGPSAYPSHPYRGVPVPDHGEVWALPTNTVPTKDGITTEWNGLRFGYRLTRRIMLDGPKLYAEYLLVNLAPFDLHFVWAMHSLMSMHVPVELELPRGTYHVSHDATMTRVDEPFEWPTTKAGEDLAHPNSLPSERGWKIFSREPVSQPAIVRYPTRNRLLKIEFTSEDQLAAYWGLWVNTGGWVRHKHFAVEPTTGRFDEIDRAVRDGSAARAPALGKLAWKVQLSLA